MATPNQQSVIGDLAVSHLDAAYNLARWLLGNEADATDAVQDAFVRALRSADTFVGGNAKAWWLTIVRNCCLARLKVRRRDLRLVDIDQVTADHGDGAELRLLQQTDTNDVESRASSAQESLSLRKHLRRLPSEFREVLILREIEELSYREISDALHIPIGTVMSRLARGREKLMKAITVSDGCNGGRV
ncbi:sigma-70 family RNA polymerase sigma factor [Rhodanobacter koreensis]